MRPGVRRTRDVWTRDGLGLVGTFVLAALVCAGAAVFSPTRAASGVTTAEFLTFLKSLRPDAERLGVSRRTFDAALAGLTPDLSLPDLVVPGRASSGQSRQAEFTRAPREYLSPRTLDRLAATGRDLARRYKTALDTIEQKTGVDRYSVLAIWGRETAFGTYKLPHDAIRVLATQAWVGRRKELFQKEFLYALKMLETGVPRASMRASWAGAMGLTQFMPSEFFVHAEDMDGDGKADLMNSVPDALGSAARQLANKGWVRGQGWGYEVATPKSADCGLEGLPDIKPISAWTKLGFRRVDGKAFPASVSAAPAYLMSPAGAHGPAFLVLENFQVIRRYNTSDLYAVFVGNLADRIAGGGDFVTAWKPLGPQRTDVIKAVQTGLEAAGHPIGKIDGFIGSGTRREVGRYQRANGLGVDCWPSVAVSAHLAKFAKAARKTGQSQ